MTVFVRLHCIKPLPLLLSRRSSRHDELSSESRSNLNWIKGFIRSPEQVYDIVMKVAMLRALDDDARERPGDSIHLKMPLELPSLGLQNLVAGQHQPEMSRSRAWRVGDRFFFSRSGTSKNVI